MPLIMHKSTIVETVRTPCSMSFVVLKIAKISIPVTITTTKNNYHFYPHSVPIVLLTYYDLHLGYSEGKRNRNFHVKNFLREKEKK
jgi:hypothetical protein